MVCPARIVRETACEPSPRARDIVLLPTVRAVPYEEATTRPQALFMKTSFSARVFDSSHLHAPMARPAIASRFTCTVSMNLGAHLKRLSSNAASGQASPRAQASESLWVKRSGALLFSGAALYTASLSYWQLERYQWKLGLIEERTKRLEDKPVTITSLLPVGDDN
eukprot:2366506-Pleurochrysis_carterae.AAC.1